MVKKKFKKNFKKLFPIVALFCILLLFVMNKFTNSAVVIENGSKVDPNSNLFYYLDILYDGKDSLGNESSDTQVANILSNTINIEDQLPSGLIFAGFEQTGDGSIGAISRKDGSPCTGYVVGGVGGLNYNSSTGKVTFQIRNLQAGCKITVGIKTVTPSQVDDPTTSDIETRRDFYNTASGREDNQSVISNTIHVWMGTEGEVIRRVSYQYTGLIPVNAPVLPSAEDYSVNSMVAVNSSPVLEGYTFSGWSASGVTISGGKFKMPNNNVVLTGSFTEKNKYDVSYSISGDVPESYTLPITKQYHEGSVVNIDNMSVGEVVDGYRFMGWESTDVSINNSTGEFTMPSKNVVITGRFELIKYNVMYKVMGDVYPSNVSSLLPATVQYAPGTTVNVADNLSDVSGYKFLGWSVTEPFTMPEEDVTIYCKWQSFNGLFVPEIREVVENGAYFNPGQEVLFKITVKNTSSFAIRDVMVRGNSSLAKFIPESGYTVRSDNDVIIDQLAANSEVNIYATYEVKSTDRSRKFNEIEIVSALGDSHYYFDDSRDYKASAYFDIGSSVRVCKTVTGITTNRKFDFHITGNKYDVWLSLQDGQCKEIFLDPGNYNIFEMQSVDFSIKSITGAVTTNGGAFTMSAGESKEINYVNQYNGKRKYLHGFGEVINRIEAIIS